MGADGLDKNTLNAPKFICPICLLKPKSLGFQQKKASLGVRSPCIEASKLHAMMPAWDCPSSTVHSVSFNESLYNYDNPNHWVALGTNMFTLQV